MKVKLGSPLSEIVINQANHSTVFVDGRFANRAMFDFNKSAKQIATDKGEAYIAVLSMELDPNDINNGSFEFDWNDKMIADLVRHGYQMDPRDTDADIVDRWFTAVCRNVVLETAEQYEAMNTRVVKSRDVGDGRSEVS
jgi:hypothetical protein